MEHNFQIKVTSTDREDGYRIFTISVSDRADKREYKIYAFDKDINLGENELTPKNLDGYAIEQMKAWLNDSGGQFPKDKFKVRMNGGKIITDNIDTVLFKQEKTSDLVRTNVTIAAPLFEWAKAKAQKESTSFSDLVSRGLMSLKDSNKSIEAWLNAQQTYFRNKLGDFGSYEVFHYLPNNYVEFGTDSLKNALQSAALNRTGWPIGAYLTSGENRPHPQEDGIKAEYIPTSYLLLDYWYAKDKGEFYFARNLESDSGNGEAEPKTSLYFDTLIWRIAEALEHCVAYYQALNISDNERVKIRISLDGLNNRNLSAWNPLRAFTLSYYVCGTDKVSWELEISLRDLNTKLDEVVYEATKKLLVMFDFFVPNKEVVKSILDQEYRKSNM